MPTPPPKRPPAEIIASIDTKAEAVRDAAAELTKRIEQFEEYLSKLHGRVETVYFGAHPNSDGPEDQLELALKLHRVGKNWIISCSDYHPNYHEYHGMDWQPLKEASLKIKIASVEMFPDLLQAVEKSQEKLVVQIKEVSEAHDNFMRTLPEAGKERRK